MWGNNNGDVVNAAMYDSVVVNNVFASSGGRAIDLFDWMTVTG